jgi:hypothetical protein
VADGGARAAAGISGDWVRPRRVGAAFRKGLGETGYFDGQNVTIEYHWLEGQYDRLPGVMADLVRRRAAVIATPGSVNAALAAKAATSTLPIVFGVGDDPVKRGLVASLARPGGNVTGINFFTQEVVAKRLALLHELVPKAVRIAVLVNPTLTATAEATLQNVREAAKAIGVEIQILNAATIGEIDAAFATLVRDRIDALFVAPDSFFASRHIQFATLAAADRIPATYTGRETPRRESERTISMPFPHRSRSTDSRIVPALVAQTGTVPRARIKNWLKRQQRSGGMHATVVPSHFLLSGPPGVADPLRMKLLHWGAVGTEVGNLLG